MTLVRKEKGKREEGGRCSGSRPVKWAGGGKGESIRRTKKAFGASEDSEAEITQRKIATGFRSFWNELGAGGRDFGGGREYTAKKST